MIRFRKVINDAVVLPWGEMPEVNPPTLKGLCTYLKKCPGWGIEGLEGCRSWSDRVIDYGSRAQFMFDEAVPEEDLLWLEKEKRKQMVYFISGHLDVTPEEFKEHYQPKIEEVMGDGGYFVVGDARGTDTLAQEFLKDYGEVTVFHMFENPRNNKGNHPTVSGFSTDEERDTAMTLASDSDIAWVRPGREKSGTAKNLKRRTQVIEM
jgi:hypothetical protein